MQYGSRSDPCPQNRMVYVTETKWGVKFQESWYGRFFVSVSEQAAYYAE